MQIFVWLGKEIPIPERQKIATICSKTKHSKPMVVVKQGLEPVEFKEAIGDWYQVGWGVSWILVWSVGFVAQDCGGICAIADWGTACCGGDVVEIVYGWSLRCFRHVGSVVVLVL